MVPIDEAILNIVERMHMDGLDFIPVVYISFENFRQLSIIKRCLGAVSIRMPTNYGYVNVHPYRSTAR